MRRFLMGLILATLVAPPASAAPTIADILAANKAASGGSLWDSKKTLAVESAYRGQGMTGTTRALSGLRDGRFADHYAVGPMTGGNGFDGHVAWMKDMSGAVAIEAGGDRRPLAVNEAYRRAHLWWQPDFGGANILSDGEKTEGEKTYDVLTVTPKDGKSFSAWFDTKTHLLARIVEKQGPLLLITRYADYKPVDGVMLPGKTTIDEGSGVQYLQTLTMTKAAFSGPQPDAAYAPPKATLTDFSIAGSARKTTIPIRILNNHIYADVMIDGKGPYNFIFDTGGQNILTPAAAKRLGVTLEGKLPSHGVGKKVMESGLTRIGTVRIGDAAMDHQLFYVLDFEPDAVEGVRIDGMLGYELFSRFVTRIDYSHRTMTLMLPDAFDPEEAGTPLPFQFYGQIPQVKGRFEGMPGLFDIDTGARDEITLTSPFVEKAGLRTKHPKGVLAVEGWGVGGPSRAYVTRGAQLTIGPFEIPDVVTSLSVQNRGSFSDAAYEGNIGGGILKRFTVTFDYRHQIMYLKPVQGPVADTGVFDRSGMWINEAKDGLAVMDVTKGGPAAKAGLKTGDVITSVDGTPATSIPVYALRYKLRNEAPGTIVAFNIKRGDSTKTVKVTLEKQI